VTNTVSPHALFSARREKILENLFSGEVLKELWCRAVFDADLLHSDIDASGYDIVLELPDGVRHIQLKASTKRKLITANAKICDRPSGCIIVMIVSEDTLDFEEFLWFGNALGQKCDDIRNFPSARHSKGNSQGHKSFRQDTFRVTVGKLERVESFAGLVDRLTSV